MGVTVPRLMFAGLSGDSGKTIVSLSTLAALRRRGLTTAVFKKGPDYIDAAWLSSVAGRVCRNLDTYMVPEATVRSSFVHAARGAQLAVIEGNRGLFDGFDVDGTHSTAGLAKLLQAPVILVVPATKVTRTLAALVHGCQTFDPDVNIAGVILNKVAGPRHAEILKQSIERFCRIPVLGSIPKLGSDADLIPGRHLGLIPPAEAGLDDTLDEKLVAIAETHLNLDRLVAIALGAPKMSDAVMYESAESESSVRIGYFRDSVFTFYYPENLEALQRHGAELVPISSLEDEDLPDVDGLYIGGGFPETHAERLAANRSLMAAVRRAAMRGLPIYAECGGLIYLVRSLTWQGTTYPMAGVFDIDLSISRRPAGHGYAELIAGGGNPYFGPGTIIRGHEFHYSAPDTPLPKDAGTLRMSRGTGLGNGRDGLVHKRTLALYTHVHASGATPWAGAVTRNARAYRDGQVLGDEDDGADKEQSAAER